MFKPMRLGEKLIEKGYVSPDQLRIALVEQKKTNKKIGETLVSLGFLDKDKAREFVGDAVGVSSMSLVGILPDPSALALISESFAIDNLVMPISLVNNELRLAMATPDNVLLLDKIKRHMVEGVKFIPVLASVNEITNAIDHVYGYELSVNGVVTELETGNVEKYSITDGDGYSQPMVRLVDAILTDSVKRGASDIHFEPEENYIRIRYRIDGVLQQIKLLHKSLWSAFVVRLKVIASLDLTDQRKPQDGRMNLIIQGRKIDFRVSSLPGSHGENFVLRVLDREKGIVSLDKLGLDASSYEELKIMMSRPTGILLVTGPTGSGKTTTLYSMLNELNEVGVNIMTLEDPIEYPMDMIRQTAVNEEIGMTFAAGIRALLRQDPDIILIGEIRDGETAEMAIRSAMTGHQVFSTLHTNSAIGAIPRLLDIGVSRSIMSGNIIGIMGQRLTRRLCKKCKKSYIPEEFEQNIIGFKKEESSPILYKAVGCSICDNSGYKGRLAVLETLRFTKEIDQLLLDGASQNQILEEALSNGFSTMLQSALRWVRAGETTLDEISRVVDLTELV